MVTKSSQSLAGTSDVTKAFQAPQRVSNVALAKRLGVSETVVRRLVHPDHASRIEKVQAALEKLGKHLLVQAA